MFYSLVAGMIPDYCLSLHRFRPNGERPFTRVFDDCCWLIVRRKCVLVCVHKEFVVQINMDDKSVVIDLVESSDEETPSLCDKYGSKILSDEDILLGKGRQEKSLGNLAMKFADLLRNSPDGVMHLNKVIQKSFFHYWNIF